jgi:hypothetical protein
VQLQPAGVVVAPGGTARVTLDAVPPPQGLAAWIVEVSFDPSVLRTSSDFCSAFRVPDDAIGASGCETADEDGDGVPETVKAFGAVLRDDGSGLGQDATLSDITFEAIGEAGDCSALTLAVVSYSGPDGEDTAPLLRDGEICLDAGAPADGAEAASDRTPRQGALQEGRTPPPVASAPVDGDGGTPALVWVLLAIVALAAVGASAWLLVKRSGGRPLA